MCQSKVWMITGASRGFGRIWAQAALRRGDRVVATARDVQHLSDLATEYGGHVLALPLDVTDRAAAFSAVGHAHQHFGRIDVVLNNAGYSYSGAVEELELEEARANFETNVFGPLNVIQASLPLLRQQGSGHILMLSSIGGVVSFPTGGSYVATKFALEAFSEALAGEVSEFGIKVTLIEPGSYSTSFRSSARNAPAMPEYDAVRRKIRTGFKPEMTGNPEATAGAILKVVDEANPPLRLILGSWPLGMIRRTYEARIQTWNAWADTSEAAQGDSPASP